MGRMSKRSKAIVKGWETRKARLQEKLQAFQQGKIMSDRTNETIQNLETVTDPSQVQLPFGADVEAATTTSQAQAQAQPEAKTENRATARKMKKRQPNRGRVRTKPTVIARPVNTPIPSPSVPFDGMSNESYSYEQIRELGAKAIYDGQAFRLLKQNGSVVFAR